MAQTLSAFVRNMKIIWTPPWAVQYAYIDLNPATGIGVHEGNHCGRISREGSQKAPRGGPVGGSRSGGAARGGVGLGGEDAIQGGTDEPHMGGEDEEDPDLINDYCTLLV